MIKITIFENMDIENARTFKRAEKKEKEVTRTVETSVREISFLLVFL